MWRHSGRGNAVYTAPSHVPVSQQTGGRFLLLPNPGACRQGVWPESRPASNTSEGGQPSRPWSGVTSHQAEGENSTSAYTLLLFRLISILMKCFPFTVEKSSGRTDQHTLKWNIIVYSRPVRTLFADCLSIRTQQKELFFSIQSERVTLY